MQSWDVHVVLRAEDAVELHATFAGQVRSAGHLMPVGDVVGRIERWLESTPGADVHLAVRTPDGMWRHVSTRRWRVAAYFLLTHYEQAFVTEPPPAVSERSVKTESGTLSSAAPASGQSHRSRRSD
jgi:hypothetical protein